MLKRFFIYFYPVGLSWPLIAIIWPLEYHLKALFVFSFGCEVARIKDLSEVFRQNGNIIYSINYHFLIKLMKSSIIPSSKWVHWLIRPHLCRISVVKKYNWRGRCINPPPPKASWNLNASWNMKIKVDFAGLNFFLIFDKFVMAFDFLSVYCKMY